MANYYNKDLYKILEVEFNATTEEIKTSYRKLVRLYHPDVTKNQNDTSKFKEIQEAYEILTDEEQRKKYDILHVFYKERIKKEYQNKINEATNKYVKYGKESKNKDSAFSKSINEAIDNLFYGKTKQQKKSTSKKQAKNGEDISLNLKISFLESINGTNRKVNIVHTTPCHHCEGRKFINGAQCQMCKGTGEISIKKKINVSIPKGVITGSKVRVKKEGNSGINGGKDGDLYLVIEVEQNPYYSIEGNNILCTLPITPEEAVLGTEITIPSIDGKINVKIPAMTSSGQKLKIPEQGLQNKSGTKKGDIIITILIKLPEKLSTKEKDLYEQLKKLSNHNIRKDIGNV